MRTLKIQLENYIYRKKYAESTTDSGRGSLGKYKICLDTFGERERKCFYSLY